MFTLAFLVGCVLGAVLLIFRWLLAGFVSSKRVAAFDHSVSQSARYVFLASLVIMIGGAGYIWLWSQGYVP